MLLAARRLGFILSVLAALAVGATPFALADMMMPCPMMDRGPMMTNHAGDIDDIGYPDDVGYPIACPMGTCVSLPFAGPNMVSSAVHHTLDGAERVTSIYSFAVTGRDPPPPFHPPRV